MVIKHAKGLKIQINFEINRIYIFFEKKNHQNTQKWNWLEFHSSHVLWYRTQSRQSTLSYLNELAIYTSADK